MVQMLITLAGGLGMFLYGMKLMGDGLERAAGSKMRGLLEILTKNRLMGVLVGAGFTMIIQSSSAATVMVVGFVNAGLMNLLQATGVIMGANFGTSITAQLVAFKLSAVAPVMLLAGVVMMLFFKRSTVQNIGSIIGGFGILFLGMEIMSDSMAPLRTNAAFLSFMQTVATNPISALLVGVVVTSIIQSSSASIALVQLLAQQGLMTLEMALYICLGCAIGTCVTAMLSSIGTSRTARRAAVVHLLNNIIGSSLMLLLLQFVPLADWMRAMTEPDDLMRQIANAMMIMKAAEIIVIYPFADYLVKLACKIIPGEDPVSEKNATHFLDDHLLITPPIAVSQTLKETERMGDIAVANLDRAVQAFLHSDLGQSDIIAREETLVNFLNHEITNFLVRVSQEDLTPADSKLVGSLYHVINDLERIGDHAENVLEFAQAVRSDQLKFSEAAMDELQEFYGQVQNILQAALAVFHSRNQTKLPGIQEMENRIDAQEKLLQQAHIDRLAAGQCTAYAGMVFSDLLSNLERVADHATNIAFSVLTDTGTAKPENWD